MPSSGSTCFQREYMLPHQLNHPNIYYDLSQYSSTAQLFLDGFSGYNQVSIDPKDQHKTAFATEWGIFAFRRMPFGLTNAPTTFQRLMSHAFKEYLREFLEIYMDDLCVHSLIRLEHYTVGHGPKCFSPTGLPSRSDSSRWNHPS